MHTDSNAKDLRANSKKHHYGRTEEERHAAYIGTTLAEAILWTENFEGGPTAILEAAKLHLQKFDNPRANDALYALYQYYDTEENELAARFIKRK